jgi:radical SAM superfamily enzyme YgiQ (UPF0313 family)
MRQCSIRRHRASYLARRYDVALFDAMLAVERKREAALARHQPRYAILYEDNFNYLSKMCLLRMRNAAFKMIRMAKARGCTVILCGADVTDHSALYIAHGADYCLIGEGEETLGELMDRLEERTNTPLENIRGPGQWTHGDEQRSQRHLMCAAR